MVLSNVNIVDTSVFDIDLGVSIAKYSVEDRSIGLHWEHVTYPFDLERYRLGNYIYLRRTCFLSYILPYLKG
jgi:hypothetical protein